MCAPGEPALPQAGPWQAEGGPVRRGQAHQVESTILITTTTNTGWW